MTRTSSRDTLLRWLTFIASAVYSIGMSATAPLGRHAFHFDWSLSTDTLVLSLIKLPHIGTAVLVALLAIWATGRQRWLLALVLTVTVGGGWELAQTTVIGHEARLADLLPDTMGALLGCVWGACGLWLLEPWRREGRWS